MYRPEGWEEKLHDWNCTHWHTVECDRAYERGADAMLEALKEKGTHLNGDTVIPAHGDYPEIHCPGGTVGWLVLIPDEEIDDEG